MQSETKLALEKLNAWVKSSRLRSNRRIDHLIMITSISRIKCKHTAAAARGDTYTLAMQKPYLACTSAASSSRTASILAMRTPGGTPTSAAAPTAEPHRRRGGRGGGMATCCCWHRAGGTSSAAKNTAAATAAARSWLAAMW